MIDDFFVLFLISGLLGSLAHAVSWWFVVKKDFMQSIVYGLYIGLLGGILSYVLFISGVTVMVLGEGSFWLSLVFSLVTGGVPVYVITKYSKFRRKEWFMLYKVSILANIVIGFLIVVFGVLSLDYFVVGSVLQAFGGLP